MTKIIYTLCTSGQNMAKGKGTLRRREERREREREQRIEGGKELGKMRKKLFCTEDEDEAYDRGRDRGGAARRGAQRRRQPLKIIEFLSASCARTHVARRGLGLLQSSKTARERFILHDCVDGRLNCVPDPRRHELRFMRFMRFIAAVCCFIVV